MLLLSMDHIITDFWSMTVLVRELLALYDANKNGASVDLSPLPARYSDFVRWESVMLESPQGEAHWEYWREQLGKDLPAHLRV